jgi:hypothetical protein
VRAEDAGGKAALLAEADATLEQLKKWANVTGDSKYYHLLAALHRARGQLATALKVRSFSPCPSLPRPNTVIC